MFDEVVQGVYRYMNMCDLCGKTSQNKAEKVHRAGYLAQYFPG
jgi:hypothetical protein